MTTKTPLRMRTTVDQVVAAIGAAVDQQEREAAQSLLKRLTAELLGVEPRTDEVRAELARVQAYHKATRRAAAR